MLAAACSLVNSLLGTHTHYLAVELGALVLHVGHGAGVGRGPPVHPVARPAAHHARLARHRAAVHARPHALRPPRVLAAVLAGRHLQRIRRASQARCKRVANTSRTRRKHVANTSQIRHKHVTNTSRTCRKHATNASRTRSRCVTNTSHMSQTHRTRRKHVANTLQTKSHIQENVSASYKWLQAI